MIVEREIDCGEVYEGKRRDVVETARSLTDEQLRLVVPATAAWSAQDVISHLVGITADLNALRFGSGDPDAWTAEQLRTRSHRSIEQLANEWETEAPRFEEGLRVLGYEIGSHYMGDLLQHASDIHHALGRVGLEDDEALVVALDFYLDSFHQDLMAAAVGSVGLRVADEEWMLGSGPLVASLTASRFETFRCLGGRRSERQILAMGWTGDLDRVLAFVSRYPLPQSDIVES